MIVYSFLPIVVIVVLTAVFALIGYTMKKGIVLQSLTCLLAVSCTVHEMETMTPVSAEDDVFYASMESYSAPDTRVYVDMGTLTSDGKFLTLWDAKDQISIFNQNTLNKQYEFLGETGANAGYFKKLSEGTGTGTSVDYVCAVYPYDKSNTSLNDAGVLTLTLPEKQKYRDGTFGLKANTMVSTTDGMYNLLRFKNVCGYLVLKLWGDNVTVSSIKLEGRNGELLSGKATMTPALDTDPTIKMKSSAKTSITLDCKNVTLGTDEAHATVFWLVVPPTRFKQGFTITVTDENGMVFIKETGQDRTVERNHVSTMTAIEVKPLDPKNVIYYTTSDKSIVTPDENAVFGESLTIISNDYIDDLRGVMVFNGNVTQIGDNAFANCEELTSMTIPDGVTTIGSYAFAGCHYLPSINIPKGVTDIGSCAFDCCWNLDNILLPSSVSYIGNNAFSDCHKLTGMTIPSNENLKDIYPYTFENCWALTSITIPENITSIWEGVFRGCTAMNSLTVQAVTPPEHVTADTFEDTNDCPIYVPAESFSDYKNATDGWGNYASRIHTIDSPNHEIQGHAYVDMGTGLKWATINAEREDGAFLFVWADGKAAAESWGGNWRLPTKEEFEILKDKSRYTWTWASTNDGYIVESQIQGYVGNTIFLPTTGRFDSSPESTNLFDSMGYYWASTPGEEYGSYHLEFEDGEILLYPCHHEVAMGIRPVAD